MRIIWNIHGDIIMMERPGSVKYRKKEEPLYGCQHGKAICKQQYTFQASIWKISIVWI